MTSDATDLNAVFIKKLDDEISGLRLIVAMHEQDRRTLKDQIASAMWLDGGNTNSGRWQLRKMNKQGKFDFPTYKDCREFVDGDAWHQSSLEYIHYQQTTVILIVK